jgi:hypothetical protein
LKTLEINFNLLKTNKPVRRFQKHTFMLALNPRGRED